MNEIIELKWKRKSASVSLCVSEKNRMEQKWNGWNGSRRWLTLIVEVTLIRFCRCFRVIYTDLLCNIAMKWMLLLEADKLNLTGMAAITQWTAFEPKTKPIPKPTTPFAPKQWCKMCSTNWGTAKQGMAWQCVCCVSCVWREETHSMCNIYIYKCVCGFFRTRKTNERYEMKWCKKERNLR